MKILAMLITICITCVSCHKKENGNLAPNLVTNYTCNSSLIDKNNYSYFATLGKAKVSSSFAFIPNGKVDSCIQLSDNAYIDCDDNLFSNYQSEYRNVRNFSVSFWCKINDMTGNIAQLYRSSINGADDDFNITIENDSLSIRCINLFKVGLFDPKYITKTIVFNKFDWNNIIVISNSTNYHVYLNGIKIFDYGRKITTTESYLKRLIFGDSSTLNSLYLNVDDINIWNYPITETDAINYYNSTK